MISRVYLHRGTVTPVLAASHFLSLAFCVPTLAWGDRLWCKDDVQPHVQSDPQARWCVMQGVLVHYFSVSTVAWWAINSVDVFLRLHYKVTTRKSARLFVIYRVVAWVLPVGLIVPPFAAGVYGYVTPLQWCFITGRSRLKQPAELWWQMVFFYGPLIFMGIISAVTMLFSVRMLWKMRRWAAKSGRTPRRSYYRLRTPISFVLVFTGLWSTLLVHRFLLLKLGSKLRERVFAWGECVLLELFMPPFEPVPPCKLNLENLVSIPVDFMVVGIACGQALLGWAVFGADLALYRADKPGVGRHDTVQKGNHPYPRESATHASSSQAHRGKLLRSQLISTSASLEESPLNSLAGSAPHQDSMVAAIRRGSIASVDNAVAWGSPRQTRTAQSGALPLPADSDSSLMRGADVQDDLTDTLTDLADDAVAGDDSPRQHTALPASMLATTSDEFGAPAQAVPLRMPESTRGSARRDLHPQGDDEVDTSEDSESDIDFDDATPEHPSTETDQGAGARAPNSNPLTGYTDNFGSASRRGLQEPLLLPRPRPRVQSSGPLGVGRGGGSGIMASLTRAVSRTFVSRPAPLRSTRNSASSSAITMSVGAELVDMYISE